MPKETNDSDLTSRLPSKSSGSPRFGASTLAIEPRMLFDGAAAGVMVEADAIGHADLRPQADRSLEVVPKPISAASVDTDSQQPTELVVIDPNVKDWQTLAAGLSPNAQLLVLDSHSDPLMQIAQTMSEGGQYSAVHLISHGQSDGRVLLGNQILNADSLERYASELAQIGDHLTADGDLLLYGCDTAGGPAGGQFLQSLALATRGDVAASVNSTGGADAGGDWTLETSTGPIEARLPIDAKTLNDYGQLLPATPTVTLTGGGVTLLGETFAVTASFSNPGSNAGFGPYVDLFVPMRGADGGASPDGVTVTGATYLGAPLVQTAITLTAGDISAGQVAHPYFTDSAGGQLVSIPAGFQAGDQLIVFQLPFGSFTPGQPGADIQITGSLSNLADVGTALNFSARGGFQYGNDVADNPAADPSLQGVVTSTAVTPALYRLTTTYIGPENETATGPNFERAYRIDVDLANGQTLSQVDLTSILPGGMQYLPISGTPGVFEGISVGAAPSGGWINVDGVMLSAAGVSLATPSTTVPGGSVTREIASVVGTASPIDASMVVQFYVPLNDATGTAILDAASGDAAALTVGSSLSAKWTPADPRDPADQTLSQSEPSAHTLTARAIATQKTGVIGSNVGGTSFSPGDTILYTLESQISDYFAAGGNAAGTDLIIVDTLSDGQLFLDATTTPTAANPVLVINRNGGTENYTLTPGVNYSVVLNAQSQQVITFNLRSALPAAANGQLLIGDLFADAVMAGGTTARIQFSALMLDSYRLTTVDSSGNPVAGATHLSINEGDYVANRERIDATILDAALDPNQPGLLSESDTSGTVFGVAGNPVSIELAGINGAAPGVAPRITAGDDVTYCLSYTVPTGDFENLALTAYLPLPIFLAADPDANGVVNPFVPQGGPFSEMPALGQYSFRALGGDGSGTAAPVLTVDPLTNSLTFSFGTRTDLINAPLTIEVCYTARASAAPYADNLFLTTQAGATSNSTANAPIASNAITQILITEPMVSVDKGVVGDDVVRASSTFDPAYSPVNPTALVRPAGDGSANPLLGVVSSADALNLNADISAVDANDTVRFAIVVTNSGSSGKGAFDVRISDVLPSNIDPASLANLRVVRGDGSAVGFQRVGGGVATVDDLFGVGIELVDAAGLGALPGTVDIDQNPTAPGANIVVVTYDAKVIAAAPANNAASSAATLFNYASNEGGADHTVVDLADVAQVTTAPPAIDKQIIATDRAYTTISAGNEQVVIGEIVTYQVTLTVPEGVTANAQFVDTLDANLSIAELVSASSSAGVSMTNPLAGFTSIVPTDVAGGSANRISFNFGTLTNTNTDNSVRETITLTYRAIVSDVAGNQVGVQRSNTAALNSDAGPISVRAPYLSVVEPNLAVSLLSDVTSADAGDVVTFTLTLNANGGVPAFDVSLADAIPAGMSYVPGSINQTAGPAFSSLSVAGANISGAWSQIDPGAPVTLTFQATLDSGVAVGQSFSQTASATWTSIPGVATDLSPYTAIGDSERTGAGGVNDYTASSIAVVNAVTPLTPALFLIQTSEAASSGANVAVGEIVRYRMVIQLPESSAADVRVNPSLPAGLRFLNDGSSTVAFVSDDAGGGITSTTLSGASLGQTGGGSVAADINGVAALFVVPGSAIVDAAGVPIAAGAMASGADPIYRLGDLVNLDRDANREFVVIEFNAIVDNTVGVANAATQPVQFGFESAGSALGTSNLVTTTVIEPNIAAIDKRVVGVTGNQVTYEVTFTNSGTQTALDVRLTDPFAGAVNQTFDGAAGVSLTSVPAGTVNNSGVTGLDVVVPSLAVGQSVTVRYSATIPDLTVATPSRNATVVYSSLSDGAAGGETLAVTTAAGTVTSTTTGERTGDSADYGAGLNAYLASDGAGLGVISGRLWDDTADYNSLYNLGAGDSPLATRAVTLTWAGVDGVFGNGDDQAFTASTDADGNYVRSALPAGSYRISTASSFTDGTLGQLNVFNDAGASGSKLDGVITLSLADAGSAANQNFIYVQQNDPPVVTVGAARSVTEDIATPFTGADLISIADPDAAATTSNEVVLTVLQGRLNVTGAGAAVVSGNGSGTVTVVGSIADINATLASLDYLNTLNYNGADTLTVTMNDRGNTGDANANGVPNEAVGDNLQHVRTVALTVLGVNDSPVAANDARSTDQNTTITGQARSPSAAQIGAGDASDTDPDLVYGDTITVQGVAAGNVGGVQTGSVATAVVGSYGALTLQADGNYGYVPGAAARAVPLGTTVNDVFTYTIRDAAGATSTATISIAITGLNDPVAAQPDLRATIEDAAPISGNAVSGNGVAGGQPGDVLDPDPDGDTVTVQGVAAGNTASVLSAGVGAPIVGSYGSLLLDASGSYTYTQDARVQALANGQVVNEVFSYTVTDSNGTTANTTITIAITGRNDPPIANDDARATDQNSIITGQALNPSVAQQAAGDVADTDPDLPNGDAITVQGLTAGAVAGPVSGGVGALGVGGSYGHLNLYADGSYQYQPGPAAQALPQGLVATDVFTYTIVDSQGSTSTATITIDVTGVNNPVVAAPDVRSTAEDAAPLAGNVIYGNGVNGGQPGDLADQDPDGDLLEVTGVQAGVTGANLATNTGAPLLGSYGSVQINLDGTYTYTQDARAQALAQGQVVQDVFSYSVVDAFGAWQTTTLTINIAGRNDPPTAIDDVRATNEDTPIAGQLIAPSAAQQAAGDVTDTDPDLPNGDTLSIQGIVAGAVPGPVTGGVGAAGIDGAFGHLTLDSAGGYSYVPGTGAQALPAGATATEVFTYSIVDGSGATSTAALTITLAGVNDPPVARADSNSIVTNAILPASGNVITATSAGDVGDSDVDSSDSLTVQGVTSGAQAGPVSGGIGSSVAGSYGGLLMQPGGDYAYTLDAVNPTVLAMLPGQTLTEVFTYSINDGNGGVATTALTITIRGVFDPPVSADKNLLLNEDTPHALSASDFDFIDPDTGDTLQAVRIDSLPASGVLLLNGSPVSPGQIIPAASLSQLVYQPAANANTQTLSAAPAFTFSVQDSSGLFDLAPNTIDFTITPVNDPPTAPTLTTTIDGSAVLGSPLANVMNLGAPTDPDAPLQTLSVRVNSVPDNLNGSFFLPDGAAVTPGMTLTPTQLQSLSFVPNPANPNPASPANGLIPAGSLQFTVLDGNGGAADGAINVNVRPIPPTQNPSGLPPFAGSPPLSGAPAAFSPLDARQTSFSLPSSADAYLPIVATSDAVRAGTGEYVRNALVRSTREVGDLQLSALRDAGQFDPYSPWYQDPNPNFATKNAVDEAAEKLAAASKPRNDTKAEDCADAAEKKPVPKPRAIKPNVFANRGDSLAQQPKNFSEQLKGAHKPFKPPAKLPPRPAAPRDC